MAGNHERNLLGLLRSFHDLWMRYERRYIGQVVNVDDPESKGRCKIIVPELGWMTESQSAWVPCVTRHGMDLPAVKEWVVVSFLNGDARRPICEGQATWMNDPSPNIPKGFDGKAQTRVIFQDPETGDSVIYDASKKELNISMTTKVNVVKYGTLTIGGGAEAFTLGTTLATYLSSLKTWMDTHTHTAIALGSITSPPVSVPGVPAPSPTVPDVKSTKILGE